MSASLISAVLTDASTFLLTVAGTLQPIVLRVKLLFDDILVLILLVVLAATIFCAIALRRNKYVSALKVDAVRRIQTRKQMSSKDKKFKIAMQAETKVEKMLQEEGWQYVYPNRRVAVSRVGHNREIDVIAVGPRILVVEVKHWRGFVWSSGNSWFQRPHMKAQTLEFENVWSDNAEKAAALRRFIENSQRIALPDAAEFAKQTSDSPLGGSPLSPPSSGTASNDAGTWYTDHALHTQCGVVVVPVVVFTNPDVKLDPDTIAKLDHVFTLDSFQTFLRHLKWQQQRTSSFWKQRFLPLVSSGGGPKECFISLKTERRVAEAVDMLRTWDVLHLHEGRIITGDVLSVTAPSAFCSYERKHLLNIRIQWNVGVLGTIKTLLTNQSGQVELVLATAKRLAVKKTEKKPRNAQGNIVFPIRPRQRKVTGGDRLVIRIPGAPAPLIIAIADIKTIEMSKHLYITEKIVQERKLG